MRHAVLPAPKIQRESRNIAGDFLPKGTLRPNSLLRTLPSRRDAAIWLQRELAPVVLLMLEAWRSIRIRAAELGRQLSQMHVKASTPHTHVDPRNRRHHQKLRSLAPYDCNSYGKLTSFAIGGRIKASH